MIKAVIFDLDGVIVSTDDCHFLAWKKLADQEGIYFDRTINERLRGVSRMGSLEIILERAVRKYSNSEKEKMSEIKNAYYVEMIKKLTPEDILPGVMDSLTILKTNRIPIAIGSSSKNSPIILKQIGLENFFDVVADGNDIKMSKPHPEVFLLAAKKLGIKPQECLVVEDADAGIEAAKAAKMFALGVGFASCNQQADFKAKDLTDKSIKILFDSFVC